MKQINEYIESNKRWIEDLKQEVEELKKEECKSSLDKVLNEGFIENKKSLIHDIEIYVKGLEDARRYIEEEN